MFGEETKTGKHNRVKTIRKKGGESGGGDVGVCFLVLEYLFAGFGSKKLKVRKFRV